MMKLTKIDSSVFKRLMDIYNQAPEHIDLDPFIVMGIEMQLMQSPQWVVHDDLWQGFAIMYQKGSKITFNPWMFGGLPVCIPGADLHQQLLERAISICQAQYQLASNIWGEVPFQRLVVVPNHNSFLEYELLKGHGFIHDYDYCDMTLDLEEDLPKRHVMTLSKNCQMTPLKELPLSEIKQLYHRCFAASDATFYKRQTTEEKVEFFSYLNYDLAIQSDASFGMICDGRLIAFIMCVQMESSSNITCMCVEPTLWHQGFGTFMLAQVEAKLKKQGIACIDLGTEAHMKAFELYRSFGFHVIGTSSYYHYDMVSNSRSNEVGEGD